MTEDEAKTKWCCAELTFQYKVPSNQHGGFEQHTTNKCVGSQCMAWREDLTREEAQSGYVAANGHCGLAGKP